MSEAKKKSRSFRDLDVWKFLVIALGSFEELETQLIIANKIAYLSNDNLDAWVARIDIIRKMIRALGAKIS